MSEIKGKMLDEITEIYKSLENATMTLDTLVENIQMECSDLHYARAVVSVVSSYLKQLNKAHIHQLELNIKNMSTKGNSN